MATDSNMKTLYYEAHITIDPVFDERRLNCATFAALFSFRLAKLIMRKRESDEELPAQDDTFMTSTSRNLEYLTDNMLNLIIVLKSHGYNVRRYKIEDTIIDSRVSDVFTLLQPPQATPK